MKNIFRLNSWFFVLGIAILTTISACTDSKVEAASVNERESATTKEIAYKTNPIAFITPEYNISVPAELEPSEQVSLFAKVEGFVKKLYVDRGEQVKKGQLLVLLDAPEMNQKYTSDKSAEQKMYSDYQYASQNYERLKEAAETQGAVAAIELDRAKSAMNSAKSAYEASQSLSQQSGQMQNYLKVIAPFDGVITERFVSEGALVGPGSGQPIFTVVDENNLRLKLSLPEKHAGSVKEDLDVQFSVNSQPGQTFKANLSRFSKVINPQDRAMTLEFDVDNSEGNLHGGEYAQVTLKLQRKTPTFWVSPKNILNTQSGLFVLTKNEDEIRRIPVKEGIRLDTITEIFGDLKEDDFIVERPTEQMR